MKKDKPTWGSPGFYKRKTPGEIELEKRQIEEYARIYERAAESMLTRPATRVPIPVAVEKWEPIESIEDEVHHAGKRVKSRYSVASGRNRLVKLCSRYPQIYEEITALRKIECPGCHAGHEVRLEEHMDNVIHQLDPSEMKESYSFVIDCPSCDEQVTQRLYFSDEILMELDARPTATGELKKICEPRKKEEQRLHTRYGEGMGYDDLA